MSNMRDTTENSSFGTSASPEAKKPYGSMIVTLYGDASILTQCNSGVSHKDGTPCNN